MKTLAICVVVYVLLFTDTVPLIHFDSWQFPLWMADMSWVGLELAGVLVAIIAVVAAMALVTMGLIGAGIVALVGAILALLFGSVMIAWPLLFVAVLCWLVLDNNKVTS